MRVDKRDTSYLGEYRNGRGEDLGKYRAGQKNSSYLSDKLKQHKQLERADYSQVTQSSTNRSSCILLSTRSYTLL
jgi:hypothetical protein